MKPSQTARRLGERFSLVTNFRARRGISGDQRGRGVGSSLEFQDRRPYQVGDDVRHLDWGAYARTDQLLVRQYEEEIQPRVEVFLDLSRSMAVEDSKFETAVNLVGVLLEAARRSSFQPKLFVLTDEPRPLDLTVFFEQGVDANSVLSLDQALVRALGIAKSGSMRVVVSDFLSPVEPGNYIPRLARGAGTLNCVQVLGEGDVDPPHDSTERLVDVESGETLERVVDVHARERYLERLARWNRGIEEQVTRVGADWRSVVATQPLENQVRDTFLASGLFEA